MAGYEAVFRLLLKLDCRTPVVHFKVLGICEMNFVPVLDIGLPFRLLLFSKSAIAMVIQIKDQECSVVR